MPPVTAIDAASARTSSRVRLDCFERAIRQSGSFSQKRRCWKARASVLRSALRPDGSVASRPAMRGPSTCQYGAMSGPMRMPSTRPTAGPSGQPQPSTNASSPAPARTASRPRRSRAARVTRGSCALRAQRLRVEEVDLLIGETHLDQRAEDVLEVRDDLGARRVEHEDPAVLRPDAVMEAAQIAVAVGSAQQPLAVRLVEAALGHDAEGRRPEPGREARRAHRARHRREAARELLVGLEPVADRALVAVVELDEVDRDLVARGDERIEVADEGVLADVVEEVVPGAPAGLEGRTGARRGARPCASACASSSAFASAPRATRTGSRSMASPGSSGRSTRCSTSMRTASPSRRRYTTANATPLSSTPALHAAAPAPITVTPSDSHHPARSAGASQVP